MRRFVCAMSLLAVSVMAAPARALPINAIDSGWYRSTGQHVAGNDNYVAGNLGSADRDALGEQRGGGGHQRV